MNPEPKLGACLYLFPCPLLPSKNLSKNGLNSSGTPGIFNRGFLLFWVIVLVALTITTAGIFFSTIFVKSGKVSSA